MLQTIEQEISENLYKKLMGMSYLDQQRELLPNGIPVHWECGYGYYGHFLKEESGKYYACFRIGCSLD